MLINCGMAANFWSLFLKYAVYLKQLSPARRLKELTPYEAWYGRKPNSAYIKVFGLKVYYSAQNQQSEKVIARDLRGRFVEYDSELMIYLI